MNKKAYKQLQKKLQNKFDKPKYNGEYCGLSSVRLWVKQCGIKPHVDHTRIICKIKGRVPYPYQKADRKFILKYLKKNKYKDFKKL